MRSFLLTWCALALLSFTGCSTAPTKHFISPSTVPITEHVEKVRAKIDSAKGHAEKAKAAVAAAEAWARGQKSEVGELKLALDTSGSEIDALTADLLGARNETLTLDTRVKVLTSEIEVVTKGANDAIDRNNKLISQNATLTESVKRWRGIALKSIGILIAVTVGALVWIFRKPLMLALVGL